MFACVANGDSFDDALFHDNTLLIRVVVTRPPSGETGCGDEKLDKMAATLLSNNPSAMNINSGDKLFLQI